ncbi:MAG: DUF1963 domain-containing protein [Planctomycetota bacterium]
METAANLIRDSDYAEHANALIESLIPKIGFTSYPWIEKYLPLGHSRFGGSADLPAGSTRPVVAGRPLPLLAQLNFGALPKDCERSLAEHLPRDGWLCLFLDISDLTAGVAGVDPGIAVMQFDGPANKLVRDQPEVPEAAEVWTVCHAVVVYPADYFVSLPSVESIDAAPEIAEAFSDDPEEIDAFNDLLVWNIDALSRTKHEVTLLGTPTLFNPDPRENFDHPDEWMLLLEFSGVSNWIAGATIPREHLDQPSLMGADHLQYFVRKTDYKIGRLDRGRFEWMMS